MRTQSRQPSAQWKSHGVLSAALKAGVLLVPAAVAVTTSAALSHVVTAPHRLGPKVVWLLSLFAVSTGVLIWLDRQLRRLLPLAALLKLSLVFPDRAPSRFRSAMRVGSARQLEQRLDEARSGGCEGESMDEAALRIVELATALRVHDRRTRGHSERVRAYADMIAVELGLTASEREKLHWAALLHDIGKLEVPSELLNKDGKPTTEEWAVLRSHPLAGQRMLVPLVGWLGPWASAAWEHHERWDGQGYPLGIAGADITLSGRIVAVADAFEVMTATRSYKKPMSAAEARAELTRCAGAHFDPDVVRALLTLSLGRLHSAMGPTTWIAQLPLLGWTAPVGVPTIGATVTSLGRTVILASALHSFAPSTVGTFGPVVDGAVMAPAAARPVVDSGAGRSGSVTVGFHAPPSDATSSTGTGATTSVANTSQTLTASGLHTPATPAATMSPAVTTRVVATPQAAAPAARVTIPAAQPSASTRAPGTTTALPANDQPARAREQTTVAEPAKALPPPAPNLKGPKGNSNGNENGNKGAGATTAPVPTPAGRSGSSNKSTSAALAPTTNAKGNGKGTKSPKG